MRRFASDLFSAHDIEFSFEIQEASHPARLEADVRRQVFLIFKENVHNIVRHSRCTHVEINLKIEKQWIILTMADDGTGFDTAQVSDGHGLMSMQRRAKELGATLEIKSQANSGTSVCLRAPLVRRHARVAEPT
jgi:signal transduction histidine kinase